MRWNSSVEISRAELDERLRKADELRLKLRRASRELAELGHLRAEVEIV